MTGEGGRPGTVSVCSIIYFIVSYCFMFSTPFLFFSFFLLVRLEPCRSVNYLSGNVASIQLVALHSRIVSESKSVFGLSFFRFQIVQLFATSSHLCNVLHNLRCANLSQFPSLLHAAQFDGTESQLTHKLSQL